MMVITSTRNKTSDRCERCHTSNNKHRFDSFKHSGRMLFPVAAIAVALSAISPVAANVEDKIEKVRCSVWNTFAP